jgi:hypothetical protein
VNGLLLKQPLRQQTMFSKQAASLSLSSSAIGTGLVCFFIIALCTLIGQDPCIISDSAANLGSRKRGKTSCPKFHAKKLLSTETAEFQPARSIQSLNRSFVLSATRPDDELSTLFDQVAVVVVGGLGREEHLAAAYSSWTTLFKMRLFITDAPPAEHKKVREHFFRRYLDRHELCSNQVNLSADESIVFIAKIVLRFWFIQKKN